MSLHPSNTIITWGDYVINEEFNIISIGKPPAQRPFSVKQEILPNGKSRKVATVNSANDFIITVDGSVADRTNFNKFRDLCNSEYIDRMRLVDSTTGSILAEWQKTILSTDDFLEGIDDGSGTNATLTFNCINER